MKLGAVDTPDYESGDWATYPVGTFSPEVGNDNYFSPAWGGLIVAGGKIAIQAPKRPFGQLVVRTGLKILQCQCWQHRAETT